MEVLLSHIPREGRKKDEEEEAKGVKETELTAHMLRSIIICLRHKLDFAFSLLGGRGQEDLWTNHIHYTLQSEALRQEPAGGGQAEEREGREGEGDQPHSKLDPPSRLQQSLTASRSSLTASRSSLTASRSNLTAFRSSLTGSRASLITSRILLAPLRPLNSPTPQDHSPSSSRASSMTASRVSLAASLAEQLHISEQTACLVHCGASASGYGFEYCGISPLVVLTPSMESSLISMATAIGNHCFPGITGDAGVPRAETTREVAKVHA